MNSYTWFVLAKQTASLNRLKEILETWASQGLVYASEIMLRSWGKTRLDRA